MSPKDPTVRPNFPPQFVTPTVPLEEPMQLGKTLLTPGTRRRWMNASLHLYCGQEGHLATTPAKRSGSSVMESTLVSQTSSSFRSPTHLSPPAKLTFNSLTVPVQVLIDSGADDNFIDQDLATLANSGWLSSWREQKSFRPWMADLFSGLLTVPPPTPFHWSSRVIKMK